MCTGRGKRPFNYYGEIGACESVKVTVFNGGACVDRKNYTIVYYFTAQTY